MDSSWLAECCSGDCAAGERRRGALLGVSGESGIAPGNGIRTLDVNLGNEADGESDEAKPRQTASSTEADSPRQPLTGDEWQNSMPKRGGDFQTLQVPDPVEQALLRGIEMAAKSGDVESISVLARELDAHRARREAERQRGQVVAMPTKSAKADEEVG